MDPSPFTLDNRFFVKPSLGTVEDTRLNKITRLEPRLMRLLILLKDQAGRVVDRDQITREIWDDYGNADEGLTQAISYLRKILADDRKKLIETIPKKGYILHAAINTELSEVPAVAPSGQETAAGKSKGIVWLLAGAALLIAGYISFHYYQKERSPTGPDMIQKEKGRMDTAAAVKGADVVR